MSFVYRGGLLFLLLAGVFYLGMAPAHAIESNVIPNDPYWERQWYLRQIHAPEAWTMTTGTKKTIVAILDGGVDMTHPDLRANIWNNPQEIAGDREDNDKNGYMDDIHGWNFITNTNDVRPVVAAGYQSEESWSHGTFVASLVGAVGNNGVGISGVNWNTQLMPLVVLDGDGFGNIPTVIRAIRYAMRQRVDVINLSLSGSEYSEELEQVIREAYEAGVFVVAATGNNGSRQGTNLDEHPIYPVCMDSGVNAMFGVGGTDTLDQKAPYANYGRLCTDLVAPAQELFGARPSYLRPSDPSTSTANYLDGMTGTSLAAPLVSGAAALLKSIRPDLTPTQLGEVLRYSADPIEENLSIEERGRMGAGRLNVARAVARVAPQALLVAETSYRVRQATGAVMFSAHSTAGVRAWTEAGDTRFAEWNGSADVLATAVFASPSTWFFKTWDPRTNQVNSETVWQVRSKALPPVQAATSSKLLLVTPSTNQVTILNVTTKKRLNVALPKALGRSIVQVLWWPERQAWILWSAERRGILLNEQGGIIADLDLRSSQRGPQEQVVFTSNGTSLQLVDSRKRAKVIYLQWRSQAVKKI